LFILRELLPRIHTRLHLVTCIIDLAKLLSLTFILLLSELFSKALFFPIEFFPRSIFDYGTNFDNTLREIYLLGTELFRGVWQFGGFVVTA